LEVFVIGAGYAAAEEAIFLTRFATKVTIIARESSFSCAPSIVDKVMANDKIEVKFNTEIIGVYGDGMIQSADSSITRLKKNLNIRRRKKTVRLEYSFHRL
jgi:thioredoxin reductase (NADPH)